MERNETRVLYKALADFSALSNAARKARKEIADLKKEERDLNRESARGSNGADNRRKNEGKLIQEQIHSLRQLNRELRDTSTSVKGFKSRLDESNTSLNRVGSSTQRTTEHHRNYRRETDRTSLVVAKLRTQLDGLAKGFNALRNWRPRLIPPFIALVPIVGGLLALINPLVAGIGALGVATFGFASSLVSLSGAALSVIPGLTAILTLVASLKTAFGGIGTVFQRYNAMKEASGGGGGSAQAELTRAEELERANIRYARALENVRWAQEDLNKAREDYIQLLKDLEKAVNDASKAEGIARDNARFSQEYATEIAGDPNVSEADQVAAQEYADYLKEQAEEAREIRIETEKELKEAERGGVDNNRQVIQAQRRLEDATWAVRDAQLALTNTQNGTAGAASAAASAEAAFRKALDKLSPSARSVVETLIALKEEWEDVQRTVQESFFKEIVDDAKLLFDLLPSLTILLSSAAGAAGRVTSDLLQQITSDEWLEDIASIAGQNVALIENYGDALGSILDIFRNITVAAGPFAVALSETVADGLASLSEITATARDDGSLAEWLETVADRLGMWWRIIKNIGKTLFNYGAASAEFGEWLTGSFEEQTERWLEASERAREEDSRFKQYLEDLKPLLSELADLAGAFFGWFAGVSADEDNIQNMKDLSELLRTDLGPALGELLDLLADSEIGEKLIGALTDLVELIIDFLEKGGLEGFEEFYSVLSSIFNFFSDLIALTPEPVLKTLAVTLGALSAMTFLGLGRILSLLSLVLGKKLAMGALTKLLGAFGLLGGAATPVRPPGAPPVRPPGAPPILPPGGGLKPGKPAGGGVGGFFGRVVKSPVGKAGLVGLIATAATEGLATLIEDGEGTKRDLAAAAIRGALLGIPGQIFSIANSDIDFQKIWDEAIEGGEEFLDWVKDLPRSIGVLVGNLWNGIKSIGSWLSEQWEKFTSWLSELPFKIGEYAGNAWNRMKGIGSWLGEQWEKFTSWLSNLPSDISKTAGNVWRFIQGIGGWLSQRWVEFAGWLTRLPGMVKARAGDIWKSMKGIGGWLGDQLVRIKNWFTALPRRINDWASSAWDGLSGWAKEIFGDFKEGFDSTQRGEGRGSVRNNSTGGSVPGYGTNDTVPSMLTPGEFVLRKSIVRKIGTDNLNRVNAGIMSLSEAMNSSTSSRPESQLSFFQNGGEVGKMVGSSRAYKPTSMGTTIVNNYTMENVNINNPVGEPSEESIIQSGQELAFVNGWV